jgi:hypothetical protein
MAAETMAGAFQRLPLRPERGARDHIENQVWCRLGLGRQMPHLLLLMAFSLVAMVAMCVAM